MQLQHAPIPSHSSWDGILLPNLEKNDGAGIHNLQNTKDKIKQKICKKRDTVLPNGMCEISITSKLKKLLKNTVVA